MKLRLLGLGLLALASAAGAQQTVTQVRASPATFSAGTTAPLQSDTHGALHVVTDATSVIGQVAIDQTTPGTTNAVVATGNVASGATDSGNPVKTGGKAQSAPTAVTANQRVDGWYGLLGQTIVGVDSAGGVGSDAVGSIGLFPTRLTGTVGGGQPVATAGYNFNGTTWDRMRGNTTGTFTLAQATTTGGLSISRLVAATNGVIKASAGQLYTGTFTNSNAAIRYLQIYNKATAGTLSTDTPVMTIPLPPGATVMIDFSGIGGAFTTGISWQFTTDDVAAPTTAGVTTDIHGFATFK